MAGSVLEAPVDHPLSLPMQLILIIGSYAIWILLFIYSVRLGFREKTPFYAVVVTAAGVGAFYEPIYDEVLMLYFYRPGQVSMFTSFDIPQPVWTLSGYVTLYASVALFVTRDLANGTMTKAKFWRYTVAEYASSSLFETIAINGGAYEYWGPHVFRIFKYPICIGLLETLQVMAFSTLAAKVRSLIETRTLSFAGTQDAGTKDSRWSSILHSLTYGILFFVFPFTMLGTNAGIGGPLIVALHSKATSEALVTFGSVVTITGVAIGLWALGNVAALSSEGGIRVDDEPFKPNGSQNGRQYGTNDTV